VDGGHHELSVIDEAGVVGVDSLEHLDDVLLLLVLSEELVVAVEHLLEGEFSVSICVDLFEDLAEVLLLALGEQLRGDVGEGGLFELLVCREGAQVGRADLVAVRSTLI